MYTLVLGRCYSVKDVILNAFAVNNVKTDKLNRYSYFVKDEMVVKPFVNNVDVYAKLLEHIYNIQDEGGHFAAEVMNVFDAYDRKEIWATEAVDTICDKIEQMVNQVFDQTIDEDFRNKSDRRKLELIEQYDFMLYEKIKNENWNDLITESFQKFISKDYRRPNGCPKHY